MKKSAKKTATKSAKKTVTRTKMNENGHVIGCKCGLCRSTSFWGKDRPLVLLLAAGAVIFIIVGLRFAGWL